MHRKGYLPLFSEQIVEALRLPPDTQILGVTLSPDLPGDVVLQVAQRSMRHVPEGQALPVVTAVYEEHPDGTQSFYGWGYSDAQG